MKILIIHRSFALVGGAERVIIEKANYLANQGHEVLLVSYEQGQHPIPYVLQSNVKFVDLNCRFFTLAKYPLLIRLYKFFNLKRKLCSLLQQTILDFSPNVVVLASDWQFLVGIVVKASKDIPVIAEFHNAYDFIIKKIGDVENGVKSKLTGFYYKRSLKQFRNCACLVSLTENDARHWRNHSAHVAVIPNPVTLYPESVNDIPKENGRILCVGRLNDQKRIDRLVTAFSMIADKYPTWHVDIFGEGDKRSALQKQISELNLQERIVLHQPTKQIYDEYKKSQFLVLSSAYEGRPLVLIEAMACGLPCVAFNCPSGPAEIIDDGVTGLLAENGNVVDLSQKMEWMITHEVERKEMSVKARKAAEIYKPSNIMHRWEALYLGVIS